MLDKCSSKLNTLKLTNYYFIFLSKLYKITKEIY